MFGKSAGLRRHSPRLQAPRDIEILVRTIRLSVNQRSFQCRYGIARPALACSNFRDLFHPLRIFVGELVQLLIVRHRVIEAHQPFGKPGARGAQIHAVRTDRDGLSVSFNRGRIIFQHRVDAGQHHGPAVILRGLLHGLGVKIHEPLLQVAVRGVQRGFTRETFVFGKSINQLDVLVHRAGIVCQALERGN